MEHFLILDGPSHASNLDNTVMRACHVYVSYSLFNRFNHENPIDNVEFRLRAYAAALRTAAIHCPALGHRISHRDTFA